MPDRDGRLTAKEEELTRQWLKKHFADPNDDGLKSCEVCNHKAWTIQNALFTPVHWVGQGVNLGLSFVQVLLFCSNCGNTKAFSAKVMGLVGDGKSDKKEGENE